MRDYLLIIGTLAGTIIGAGIFSLPYIFQTSGVLLGVFYLVLFAFVYSVVHWMYAKLILKNSGTHQFFYLAEKYLPRHLAKAASYIILAELLLVMLVYLILAPDFMQVAFGFNGTWAVFIFWALGSVLAFVPLKTIGFLEALGTFMILCIVFVIVALGFMPELRSVYSTQGIAYVTPLNLGLIFLPFGPLLFSLSGRPAVAKVVEEYKRLKMSSRKNFSLTWILILGTCIPALVYAFFVFGVLRLNPNTGPETLPSLGFLPGPALVLMGVMGLVTIITSYFMMAVNVHDIFKFDLKLPAWVCVGLVCFVPLFLYLFTFQDFLRAVSFTGGVFLALESIFVIWMWQKAYPRSAARKTAFLLYLVFVAALAYEVANFV